MTDNSARVQQGFRIMLPLFATYVCREIKNAYGDKWWKDVLYTLGDSGRDLPADGDWNTLVDALDIANALRLFDRHWNDIFRKKLSLDYRTWGKELMSYRNKLAHIGTNDIPKGDAWRALDTMARICDAFDDESAEDIRTLLRAVLDGEPLSPPKPAEASGPMVAPKDMLYTVASPAGLPSWRDVIEPHPDVAQGRYKVAEFAADLAQVARGEGAYEYRDPVAFFERTYVTEGMKGLLVQALRRVNGKDGEPVIQLKTAFGGGKTHSMLALYHMMRGSVTSDKVPALAPVLAEAGVSALPKAKVAVLVGSALNPAGTRRPHHLPGIMIHTLWGEMTAQLAQEAGDLSLYDLIKESDAKGVSPGSVVLKEIFDACGPCVVLMDELVVYGKKLYGKTDLPAGTYDNFITFIQELSEAARASRNSLVVASIPESEIEIGAEGGRDTAEALEESAKGKKTLAEIEHTFGRMESVWKPVAANEGFEIVRRRLFLPCRDEAKREEVCAAFSQMYLENAGDFPIEAKEVEYRKRLSSCYPIHPEVFDRLYEDWATLERFQRTRGVLRLMAAVIHRLWMDNDAGALIMPGSFPFHMPNVRDELTRYLSEGWNGIVDREVDGPNSVPYQKDQSVPRYARRMAARRVARTILLGSAPTDRAQAVRGVEASRIRLGVIQPGDSVADFNDALNTLQVSLAYLYTNPSGSRYWYDTRPTLRKTAEDKASQFSSSEVDYEIERRLGLLRKDGKNTPFAGVISCPNSSLDVPDDQVVRLVLLRPSDVYKSGLEDCEALRAAREILGQHGNSPRTNSNMLAFVAPDRDRIHELRSGVREYLAWSTIKSESEDLNLDAAQNRETEQRLIRSGETVDSRIKETWCWLLTPYIDRERDVKTIIWESINISGGDGGIVGKASDRLRNNEALITKWSPIHLKKELDDLLWGDGDSIPVKRLWEYFCTHCYLPRLANRAVLEDAIRAGVNSTEYFSLAAGVSGDKYIDLKYNQNVESIDSSALLVKNEAAMKQIIDAQKEQAAAAPAPTEVRGTPVSAAVSTASSAAVAPDGSSSAAPQSAPETRFFLSANLDTIRVGRDIEVLVDEVITHLTSLDDCDVTITLEVSAKSRKGFTTPTIRTVSENCRTLKIDAFGFEK